jgi:hypothetical protein
MELCDISVKGVIAMSTPTEFRTPRWCFNRHGRSVIAAAIHAWAAFDQGPCKVGVWPFWAGSPHRVSLRDIALFNDASEAGGIEWERVAPRILRLEEHVVACAGDLWPRVSAPRQAAARVAGYLAAIFTPAAALCGRWDIAVDATRAFLDRLLSPFHTDISGAGRPDACRLLLLVPVIWSVLIHCPAPAGGVNHEYSRKL